MHRRHPATDTLAAAVRILTVGNMYPPHHLGGYELTWRSSVEHLRRAGHEVSRAHHRLPPRRRPTRPSPRTRTCAASCAGTGTTTTSRPSRCARRSRSSATTGAVLDRAIWRTCGPTSVCWWAMGGMSLSLIERVRRAGLAGRGGGRRRLDALRARGRRLDALARAAPRPADGSRDGSPACRRELDLARHPVAVQQRRHPRPRAARLGLRLDLRGGGPPGHRRRALRDRRPARDWALAAALRGAHRRAQGDRHRRRGARAPSRPRRRSPCSGTGDERFLAELRAQCARLGVEDRVEFGHRPRDELPAAYAEADALLFPVRWEEPWGLVPLEAMAVGTPVVATGHRRLGGVPARSRERSGDRPGRRAAGAGGGRAGAGRGSRPARAAARASGMATAARFTEDGLQRGDRAGTRTGCSLTPPMLEASLQRILSLAPDEVVLDIGAWGRPARRAPTG